MDPHINSMDILIDSLHRLHGPPCILYGSLSRFRGSFQPPLMDFMDTLIDCMDPLKDFMDPLGDSPYRIHGSPYRFDG